MIEKRITETNKKLTEFLINPAKILALFKISVLSSYRYIVEKIKPYKEIEKEIIIPK